jgi:type 1 fimbria pilin
MSRIAWFKPIGLWSGRFPELYQTNRKVMAMKILMFLAGSMLLASSAVARPCIDANVQNNSTNSNTVNQNCDVNISGSIQAGDHNSNRTNQNGRRNHSRTHQIGDGSNFSSTRQRGRTNVEGTTQRGRHR